MGNLNKRVTRLESANGLTPDAMKRWDSCSPEIRALFTDDGTPEGRPPDPFTWEGWLDSLPSKPVAEPTREE